MECTLSQSLSLQPSVDAKNVQINVAKMIFVRNVSQHSVVMRLRCGGIFNYCCTSNLLLSLSVKEF